jgi:hypothetical protein
MAAVRAIDHAFLVHSMTRCSIRRATSVSLILTLCWTGRPLAQTPTTSGFTPLVADSIATPPLGTRITTSFTGATVAEAVSAIAAQSGLSLTYDPGLPGLDRQVTVAFTRATAASAILRVLERVPIQAMVSSSGQVVLVARPAARRAGVVSGTIRDAITQRPVAGARVELVGTRFATLSREAGDFSLGVVPPGSYAARITRLGFRPVELPEFPVIADADMPPIDVRLDYAPISLATVVVTPGYFGMMESSLAAPQAMSRERIETVPQIAEDIYRAVNRLPGVAATDFSADFAVRGGSGAELYATLDGLELVEPFHLKDMGGALSIIDSRAVGGLELITGGFSSEYGDRLTGVFSMRSVDPTSESWRTSIGLSVMNVRLMSQGRFARGRGGWLVSARRGYLDLALRLASVADSIEPTYYDVFAKAQYDLGRSGRVAVHVLDAGDALTYLDTPDPSIRSRYRSSYGWVTWESSPGRRVRQRSVASLGRLTWSRDGDGTARDGAKTALVGDRRDLTVGGVRQDWSVDVTSRLLVKVGAEVRQGSAGYDYFSTVRSDVFDPATRTLSYTWDTTSVAASPSGSKVTLYAAPRVRITRTLTAELGARYDRVSHTGDELFSPRLNLAWQPRVGTSVRGAWGTYWQSQPLSGLQAQDGVDRFYPAERAEHRVLGFEQSLPIGLTGRVEAYDRRISNQHPRFATVGPGVDVFPEITWDRVRIDPSRGRARGVELLLSRDVGARADWSLGYALANVTDHIDGREVPRAMDQRHTVTGDWAYRPSSNRWRFSVAGVWHSGWPYTPTFMTVDTLENSATTFSIRAEQTLGELYSERLPGYRRIDARYTRYIDMRNGRVSLFAEVYNLFGFHNRRGYQTALTVDPRRRAVSFSRPGEDWIPRLPTFGVTYEFGGSGR